jgi:hypothetical protein
MRTFLITLLSLTLLTGCANASAKTATPAASTLVSIPTLTVPPLPSATPHPTFTITPTDTPSPTASPTPIEFSFYQIRPVPDGDTNTIWTAFWQEDENSIYYAVIRGGIYENLAWFVADIRDAPSIKEKQLLSAPPILYSPIPHIQGINQKYHGAVSPSGRYHLKYSKQNRVIYIYDTLNQLNFTVMKETGYSNIRNAYWAKAEDKVIFGAGGHFGTFIFLYDLKQQKLVETEELLGLGESDLYDFDLYEWAPSPDGKYIARLDRQELTIVSLNDKSDNRIPADRQFQNLRWSGDSKRLYFFYGKPGEYSSNFQAIGFYDISTKTTGDIIELSMLKGFIKGSFFDVSPDGKQFIFWGGDNIWLLSLK